MLENTYDASGINFGIIISKDLSKFDDNFIHGNSNEINDAVNRIRNNPSNYIIDFNNIDGLTVDEILDFKQIQMNNTIFVVAYSKIEYTDRNKMDNMYYNILYNIIVPRTELNKDKPIDKVVEGIIKKVYSNSTEKDKRYMKCFLERYRFGSKEKTDEKIKEYINRK